MSAAEKRAQRMHEARQDLPGCETQHTPLSPAQRSALGLLAGGRSLRGLAHGVTINHLKMKRLIEDSDTITDAGRAAIAKTTGSTS